MENALDHVSLLSMLRELECELHPAHVNSSGELLRHTNRSSIWRLASAGWQMVFHQGTPTAPFDQSAT